MPGDDRLQLDQTAIVSAAKGLDLGNLAVSVARCFVEVRLYDRARWFCACVACVYEVSSNDIFTTFLYLSTFSFHRNIVVIDESIFQIFSSTVCQQCDKIT